MNPDTMLLLIAVLESFDNVAILYGIPKDQLKSAHEYFAKMVGKKMGELKMAEIEAQIGHANIIIKNTTPPKLNSEVTS